MFRTCNLFDTRAIDGNVLYPINLQAVRSSLHLIQSFLLSMLVLPRDIFPRKFTSNHLYKGMHTTDRLHNEYMTSHSNRVNSRRQEGLLRKNNVHMVNCSEKNKMHVFILSS